jgi:hypothetical protein
MRIACGVSEERTPSGVQPTPMTSIHIALLRRAITG